MRKSICRRKLARLINKGVYRSLAKWIDGDVSKPFMIRKLVIGYTKPSGLFMVTTKKSKTTFNLSVK